MYNKILRPYVGLNKGSIFFRKQVLRNTRSSVAVILFVTLALTAPATVLAEEDDYLNQLSTEADNTYTQTKNSKKLDAAELKQFEQMERMLANERPTTYKFYKKLANENKEKVFKVHISKNKLSITSKTIMDLYFSN